MKKTVAFILLSIFLFTLASCTSPETPEQTTYSAPVFSASEEMLSFLSDNEIYIDLHISDGVFDNLMIKIDDLRVTESGIYPFTAYEAIKVEGCGNETRLYVAAVNETGFYNLLTPNASQLDNILFTVMRVVMSKKMYLLITDSPTGYNNTLNQELNGILTTILS